MSKRRKKVITVSFVTAVILTLAIWGTVNFVKYSNAEKELSSTKERALTSLGTYLDEISTDLYKCSFVSSAPMMGNISEKIWRNTASAKMCLSEIAGENELSGMYKFLSQAGEYALSLGNKLKSGKSVSKEDKVNITKLGDFAKSYSKKTDYLINERESGTLEFEEIKSTLSDDGKIKSTVLFDELKNANESSKEYPKLIYDGPYSDSIETKKSMLTEHLPLISKEKAQKKAADFLGIDKSEIYFFGECKNNLPCFVFFNASYTVSVTQNGGLISYMLCEHYAGEVKITEKEAVKKAGYFLSEKGYKNMVNRYYSVNDGICTVNFVYCENDTLCYPDIIKVGISLDTGEITSFDATGYIMNHTQRSLNENHKYTLKSASRFLDKSLVVLSRKKAVIPTDYTTEYYVYEYRCKTEKDEEIMVYIDPDSGEEKDVLMLLYSDNGILTK